MLLKIRTKFTKSFFSQRCPIDVCDRTVPATDRACNGMEDGMEEEFWYGIWKISGMERNERF